MFLWVLDRLTPLWPGQLEALGKITFRASLAAAAAFGLALVLGPRLIAWLAARFREPNKSDSADVERLHQAKHATPTMGGLFIVAGLVGGMVIFGDATSRYLQVGLLVALGLAAVGALDDLVKLRGESKGISARAKLAGQILVSTAAAAVLYHHQAGLANGLTLRVPLAGWEFSLGVWFIPWAALVLVACSNAVNLTDGLDGLAGGSLIFATAAMTVAAYAAGHAELAAYLGVARIPGAGELTVLGAAMIGAVLGFLWFNCHPAQVFMGDTGSLALGGLLGLLALSARQELLLLIVGGVFVAEAASVILQVAWYKRTRRRIFLCAPLHHHFQLKGWPEGRIVVRFWIASALCALAGLASLKLQVHDGRGRPAPTSVILSAAKNLGRGETLRSAQGDGGNAQSEESDAQGDGRPAPTSVILSAAKNLGRGETLRSAQGDGGGAQGDTRGFPRQKLTNSGDRRPTRR